MRLPHMTYLAFVCLAPAKPISHACDARCRQQALRRVDATAAGRSRDVPRADEGQRRAGDPRGRSEARAGIVRRHQAQARAGHRRGRRPARSGRADEARHPGRQRAGRQQQRGRRIRGHRRVGAAAAVRLGRRRDQGRQLRQIPRPHGRRQSRRPRGADGRARRFRHHRPRGGAGVPSHGLRSSASSIRPRRRRAADSLDARADDRSTNCLQRPMSCRCTCRCCPRRRT